MKILVIQLARLGDIYMSWPVIRALQDQYPHATVDVLVRPRFAVACAGLECINEVKYFPTKDILNPLMESQDLVGTLTVIDQFLEGLRQENYDRVVNLTYSEVSSYVTSFLADGRRQISGYSRHQDGFLHLVDDVSRYFWAQVGPGGTNQIHLIDLLAGSAGVELKAENFCEPQAAMKPALAVPYYVLHLGASESHKRLTVEFWTSVIQKICESQPHHHVVLIGSENEKSLSQRISEMALERVHDFVGQTEMKDLFGYLKYSQGLIGGDSVPMHMIPFVNQRALCFSVGEVNPFETGPITSTSWIFRAPSEASWSMGRALEVLEKWLSHEKASAIPGLHVCGDHFPRVQSTVPQTSFSWSLLKAIYMGDAFPVAEDLAFYQGCLRMFEASHVSLQNLRKHKKIKAEFLTALLDRVDEILAAVTHEVPALYPLFRWYQAEKTRIQPGTFVEMVEDHILIVGMFQNLLKKYLLEDDIKKAEQHAGL